MILTTTNTEKSMKFCSSLHSTELDKIYVNTPTLKQMKKQTIAICIDDWTLLHHEKTRPTLIFSSISLRYTVTVNQRLMDEKIRVGRVFS